MAFFTTSTWLAPLCVPGTSVPGALAADTVRALETSEFAYISPLRSDGRESTCHGEVWYAWLDGAVLVNTASKTWKARSLAKGLDRARIWVGDYGVWKRAVGRNEKFREGPSFDARVERVKDDALIASNTSSISITRLASATDRPEKFMGMHFMNPVPMMKLVELIRGLATDDETFTTVQALTEKLGKTGTVSEDFPAFIVNRILLPMINEAVYTLYEGVGTVESIDMALRLGANHPMGPLQLADFIGLDTCLAIMHVLYDGLADSKYRPCPLLVKYVEAGWVGRKSGRGFYDYSTDEPVPTR